MTVDFVSALPALPASDIGKLRAFYTDVLGFSAVHEDAGFALLRRGSVALTLWAATDERWRERTGDQPVVSGAESFIAGTASCRIGVRGIRALYADCVPKGIVHPNGELERKPWGSTEFAVRDPDNNLITFFDPP